MADRADIEAWDDLFRSSNPAKYYERPLDDRSRRLGNMLEHGSRVLDLGCGMGWIDLHLAELGHDVTAVDFSRIAIGYLESFSKARGIGITTLLKDIGEIEIDGPYDLVIAFGSLQFLRHSIRDRVLREMMSGTRKGGLNYVSVLTDRSPLPPNPRLDGTEPFREGELFELYRDWETVERDSPTNRDADGWTYALDLVIAKRPSLRDHIL